MFLCENIGEVTDGIHSWEARAKCGASPWHYSEWQRKRSLRQRKQLEEAVEEPKETENFRPKTPGPSYKHWVFAVYERTLLVTGKTRGNQSRKDSFSSMLYFIKTKNFNSCNEESCINMLLLLLSRFSRVRLCATPQTAAHQALLSLGFSRQEHWSGLPFPSPMHESEKWKWSCSVVSDS